MSSQGSPAEGTGEGAEAERLVSPEDEELLVRGRIREAALKAQGGEGRH